jgi:hypothetical protein
MGCLQAATVLHMLRLTSLIFFWLLFFLFSSMTLALAGEQAAVTKEQIAELFSKRELWAKTIQLPGPEDELSRAGLQAAKKTAAVYNSTQFQEKLQCEQRRISEEVYGKDLEPWTRQQDKKKAKELAVEEKLFFLFSSSMPDETVQAYLMDLVSLEEPGFKAVMNGFVGGRGSKEAEHYFSSITREDLHCLDDFMQNKFCKRYRLPIAIDSGPFQQFGVTRVPALVYSNKDQTVLIKGDASLLYLLTRINEHAKSEAIKQMIKKIKKKKGSDS